jgi:hypothetical protein
MNNLKRRDFLKLIGITITAPMAMVKVEPKAIADSALKITSEEEFERIAKRSHYHYQETCRIERTCIRNKIFAVSKNEKIYLDYYKIKQTTQKPLIKIIGWENNLKYVYIPLVEIKYSYIPLPRHYADFESEQPLERGDLIIIKSWDGQQDKEYIIVEVQPIFETFEMQDE